MANAVDILEVGAKVRGILLDNAEVTAITTKIFPVAVDKAECPYIAYRRASTQHTPVSGVPGPYTAQVQFALYTADYPQGIALAKAVINALDAKWFEGEGWRIRRITLTDACENWVGDAYEQLLTFSISM